MKHAITLVTCPAAADAAIAISRRRRKSPSPVAASRCRCRCRKSPPPSPSVAAASRHQSPPPVAAAAAPSPSLPPPVAADERQAKSSAFAGGTHIKFELRYYSPMQKLKDFSACGFFGCLDGGCALAMVVRMPQHSMQRRKGDWENVTGCSLLRKRCLLAAVGALWVAIGASLMLLTAPSCAFAYVDPSVMTYTIQALAGVAVALGAVFGVMWRRVRRKVLELLNIDEDYGKVREGAVHRAGAEAAGADCAAGQTGLESSSNAASSANAQPSPRRGHSGGQTSACAKQARRELSYPKRFGFALVAMAFVMYTYFVAGPYEIVGGNAESFFFTLRDVWLIMLVFAVVVGTGVAALIALLKGRAFNIAVGASFALAFAGFLQALFMNEGLPSADGHVVPWSDLAGTMVVNALVWVAIIAACIFLVLRFPSLARACIVVLAFVCMATQTIGIARYVLHGVIEGYTEPTVTKQGLFEVASQNNVIVLLVDTADTQAFENMMVEFPDALDDFTGFTYFPDSVGCFIPTSEAVPFLLSGERVADGETYDEYEARRNSSDAFIREISDAGYSIGLYADCIYAGKALYGDKTMNIMPTSTLKVDVAGTIGILSQVTLYRDAPWVLKPFFWYYTDDINQSVMGDDTSSLDNEVPYILNDARYYEELQERGLAIRDEEGKVGAFRLIHLNGAHVPYTYDQNMEYAEDGSTMEHQLRGVFTILQEYLNDLKELGVYDDATIFVMADHGYWESDYQDLESAVSPLCLVKPSTQAGGSNAAVQTSLAPVSQGDFHPTVIEAIGGDKSKYGTGLTFFEIPIGKRLRYFDSMKYDGVSPTEIWEYEVNGFALDFDNWRRTGKHWAYNG